MKKLILLLSILFMIPGCLFAQSEPDYNPMSVGNYWIQHTDTLFGGYNPTTFRTDVEGIDLIGGNGYFRIKQEQTVDDGSKDPSIWYVWTGQDSTGGLLGAFGSTSDIDSALIYDPPILSLPIEASTVGYAWEYDMPGTGSGGQHFACIMESFSETVEIPIGIYNDCLKMSTIITDTSGATTQTYDLYYAEGVRQILNQGWSLWSGNYKFELIEYYVQPTVDVKKSQNVPILFSLHQNYPNPFNPSTTIRYDIKEKGFVSLVVYDISGREVVTLVNEYKDEGYYFINFDASNLPSGVYIYKLKVNNFVLAKKMTYLK